MTASSDVGVECPACKSRRNRVSDSRPTETTDFGASIRRRRICHDCHQRFTTYELPAKQVEEGRSVVAKSLIRDLLDVVL